MMPYKEPIGKKNECLFFAFWQVIEDLPIFWVLNEKIYKKWSVGWVLFMVFRSEYLNSHAAKDNYRFSENDTHTMHQAFYF